jgi:hypothetical protein
LGEENPNLYRSFLKELTESLDPQSTLESLLVEKLATTTWRYRRLLLAESAAIQKNIDDVSTERVEREDAAFDSYVAMEDYLAQTDREGLLAKIAEPGMLEDGLEKLSQLRRLIDKNGPDVTDWVALGRVYGARYKGRPGRDLFDLYLDCTHASHSSEVEPQEKGFGSKEDGLKKFLVELDKEIQRLEGLPKKPKPKPKLPDMRLLACNVPDAPVLDRLLRYEASLERSFDRTLSQLERLQRMRLGQPVLPKLEVRHSLS